jgi:hypothetical protein
MDPAVLAYLIRGVGVEALAGAQLLDQLQAKLALASLLVLLAFDLPQPNMGPANHEITQPHALPATAQRIQRLPDGRRFGN